jgi:hypothetical protein
MIRGGQKYRAIEPLEVIAFSSWRAPVTSGSRGALHAGELFTVDSGPHSEAIVVCCVPETNEMQHAVFISEANRSSARYRDYYLCIAIKDILEKCEQIPN